MRGVAQHLGVSKSALYHYFPTKEALFLACTQQVMHHLTVEDPQEEARSETEQLAELFAVMKQSFGAEMALVFDYLRGKDPTAIQSDPAMQLAVAGYRDTVVRIVGPERTPSTLNALLGALLMDHFTGGKWPVSFDQGATG